MSDRWREWCAAGCRLGGSLLLFLLPPIAFLAVYLLVFGAPSSVLLPHLSVVASAWAALAGLRLGLHAFSARSRRRGLVAAVLVAVTAIAMLVFYGLVLLGLRSWGRIPSTKLISAYVPQAAELLRALGYSPWLIAVLVSVLVGMACFASYRFLSRFDWLTPVGKQIPPFVAASLALLLLTFALASAAELPFRDWGKQGEPLSLTLFPERGETAMQGHAIGKLRASRLDMAEDAVRAAYVPSATARRSNVIVIVVDALRADHLSLLGYSRRTSPNLDAMAAAGSVRLRATAVSVCNESSCGLRALASSRYVDGQATRPITLQQILRLHGYGVHMVLSGDHTSFYGLREAYGHVESYLDGSSQKARYMNDDRLVLDHLSTLGSWNGQPAMFQFHLMSAHALGKRWDDTPEFGAAENYDRLGWRGDTPEKRQRAINFYDRGVLQVDRVVHDILSLLEARGYLRDALVVVTGDHGESLGERGRYGHTHSVWEEALRVPLLILAFGAADVGKLETGPVISQVDIAPTLLRSLGMPIPTTWEGQALQAARNARVVHFQQQEYIGLVDARADGGLYKHWSDTRSGKQLSFDLRRDPGEQHDITASVPLALRQEWQRTLLERSAAIVPDGQERREQARKGNEPR